MIFNDSLITTAIVLQPRWFNCRVNLNMVLLSAHVRILCRIQSTCIKLPNTLHKALYLFQFQRRNFKNAHSTVPDKNVFHTKFRWRLPVYRLSIQVTLLFLTFLRYPETQGLMFYKVSFIYSKHACEFFMDMTVFEDGCRIYLHPTKRDCWQKTETVYLSSMEYFKILAKTSAPQYEKQVTFKWFKSA